MVDKTLLHPFFQTLSPHQKSTSQLHIFSHFGSFHVTTQHKSKAVFSTRLCSKQPKHISACQKLTSYGNVIVLRCAAGAGPFSGSVVTGCILLSATSKVLCSSGSFYFTTRLVQKRHAGRINPSLPATTWCIFQTLSLQELKLKEPCTSASSPSCTLLLTNITLHHCSTMDSALLLIAEIHFLEWHIFGTPLFYFIAFFLILSPVCL